jgi:hypothetical protein
MLSRSVNLAGPRLPWLIFFALRIKEWRLGPGKKVNIVETARPDPPCLPRIYLLICTTSRRKEKDWGMLLLQLLSGMAFQPFGHTHASHFFAQTRAYWQFLPVRLLFWTKNRWLSKQFIITLVWWESWPWLVRSVLSLKARQARENGHPGRRRLRLHRNRTSASNAIMRAHFSEIGFQAILSRNFFQILFFSGGGGSRHE